MDFESIIKQRTERVEELTDRVMRGEIEDVVLILGKPIKIESMSRGGVMRGIAMQLLPENWEWDVYDTIDSCRLVIAKIKTPNAELRSNEPSS